MPRTSKPRKKLNPMPVQSAAASAPKADRADSDAILARIKRLQAKYAARREMDSLLDALYDMQRPERKEEGEERVISSKPMDTVHLATDLVSTNTPLIDVPPLSDKQADLAEASLMEKFLLAVWMDWQRESVEPIIYTQGFYANQKGRYCHRVMYVDADLPVQLQIRNPKFIYPEFDTARRLWAVAECMEREDGLTVGDLRRMGIPNIDDKLDNGRGEPREDDEKVAYACWWDAVRYIIFVDGVEVYREEHGYEMLPWVYGYGRVRPGENEARHAVSILQGMLYTAQAYDLALSAKVTAALANVFTSWVHESDRADALLPADLTSGKIIQLFTGEKLLPLQRQGVPADLDSIIDKLKEELDNTGFRTTAGQGDASSGYAFNQLSRGEKLKINPVAQSLERSLSKTFEMVLQIIARSGKAVELWAYRQAGKTDIGYTGKLKVTPAMARKYKVVNVTVPPDYLQDMTQNVSMALQVTAGQNPLLDRSTTRRKFLNETDDEGIEGRILDQKLTELVLPAWATQYLSSLLGIAQQQMAAQQGAQGQQMQTNNGMPVTTPNTPQQPDSMAGVPPTDAGTISPDEGIGAALGQGLPPEMAQQLLMAQGTPQSSGRGR